MYKMCGLLLSYERRQAICEKVSVREMPLLPAVLPFLPGAFHYYSRYDMKKKEGGRCPFGNRERHTSSLV